MTLRRKLLRRKAKKTAKKFSRSPLRKESVVGKAKRLLYQQRRKEYLATNPHCEIRVMCVRDIATDIHHVKGRGIYTNDVSTFKATCRKCHDYLHYVNPKWAREKGFLQ